MTKKYLLNPFDALYQDDILLSDKPEIKELDEYARGLEDQIEGDFDLKYLSFEFAYKINNQANNNNLITNGAKKTKSNKPIQAIMVADKDSISSVSLCLK